MLLCGLKVSSIEETWRSCSNVVWRSNHPPPSQAGPEMHPRRCLKHDSMYFQPRRWRVWPLTALVLSMPSNTPRSTAMSAVSVRSQGSRCQAIQHGDFRHIRVRLADMIASIRTGVTSPASQGQLKSSYIRWGCRGRLRGVWVSFEGVAGGSGLNSRTYNNQEGRSEQSLSKMLPSNVVSGTSGQRRDGQPQHRI